MLEELFAETGTTLGQFILALIVVVALIVLVGWIMRRFGSGRLATQAGTDAELHVINTLALDSKRRLILVRHGKLEHLLLIGGGSDAVVERSLVGGVPIAARLQASRATDSAQVRETQSAQNGRSDKTAGSIRFAGMFDRHKKSSVPEEEANNTEVNHPDMVAAGAAAVAGAGVAATSLADLQVGQTETDLGAKNAERSDDHDKPVEPSFATESKAPASIPTTEEQEPITKIDTNTPSIQIDMPEPLQPDPPQTAAPNAQTGNDIETKATTLDRDNVDQILGDALSASLLEPADASLDESAVTSTTPAKTNDGPASSVALNEASLEREIEAALTLDGFDGQEEEGTSPSSSFVTPLPSDTQVGAANAPKDPDPDPLSLEAIRSTKRSILPPVKDVDDPSPAKQNDQPKDAKIETDERPVFTFAMPTRGSGASAATMGGGATQAAPSAVQPSDVEEPKDGDGELDDEMHKLLGELSKEPNAR